MGSTLLVRHLRIGGRWYGWAVELATCLSRTGPSGRGRHMAFPVRPRKDRSGRPGMARLILALEHRELGKHCRWLLLALLAGVRPSSAAARPYPRLPGIDRYCPVVGARTGHDDHILVAKRPSGVRGSEGVASADEPDLPGGGRLNSDTPGGTDPYGGAKTGTSRARVMGTPPLVHRGGFARQHGPPRLRS